MLNQRSSYLVVLVATHNRLELLKKVLASIRHGTQCSHEIVVIDGGSTDGTIEFLRSEAQVTPVFQGRLLGPGRAYNEVWKRIDCRYTCWLSDDTEIKAGSLDLATGILENDPAIGMVGLKMQDTTGPWSTLPYKTGVSEYGILNCNHGVLPLKLLASVGYFDERYVFTMIDPDLTAAILCTGKKVVMTKDVGVLHHRAWSENLSLNEARVASQERSRGSDNRQLYREKFGFLSARSALQNGRRVDLKSLLARIIYWRARPEVVRLGLSRKHWVKQRFIRLTDALDNLQRPYHLVQQIPSDLLATPANPYHPAIARSVS